MPGCVACRGGHSSMHAGDFPASSIGDRTVDRQGIEPSLVAIEPWMGRHRALVVVEVCLRRRGKEASMPTRVAMPATREAIKFGDPEYPCRSPRRPGPSRRVAWLDLAYVRP
jgi:hypothetical protein